MSWEFKVGQKVVCVDASRHPHNNGGRKMVLREKEIYTIRGFITDRNNGLLLTLEETPRNDGTGDDLAFKVSRFRPLVTDTQPWLAQLLAEPPHQTPAGPRKLVFDPAQLPPGWMGQHG